MIVEIKIKRNTFDDSLDSILKLYVEIIGSKDIDIINMLISCNVCQKKRADRSGFLRRLCDNCKYYYDYCIEHISPPTVCPLCNQ
jgi:hypothetical protein